MEARDKQGRTPLDIAKASGVEGLVEILAMPQQQAATALAQLMAQLRAASGAAKGESSQQRQQPPEQTSESKLMKTANTRIIRAPTGTELSAKSWLTEAPLRMIMNNLQCAPGLPVKTGIRRSPGLNNIDNKNSHQIKCQPEGSITPNASKIERITKNKCTPAYICSTCSVPRHEVKA